MHEKHIYAFLAGENGTNNTLLIPMETDRGQKATSCVHAYTSAFSFRITYPDGYTDCNKSDSVFLLPRSRQLYHEGH